MARQYKLRLRDGTILAVDQAGLRTWLIDDRAMVQPMGTRGWRPLREVLAQASLAAAMSPPPSSPPPFSAARPQPLADEEIPEIPIKPLSLAAPAGPDPVLDAPVDAFVPERLAEPPPAAAPAPRAPAPPPPRQGASPAASPAPTAAPRPVAPAARAVAPPVAPVAPVSPVAARAVAPPPAPVARPAAASVAASAKAPVTRTPPPPHAARPMPARAAALVPEPEPEDAPPAMADLPIIPFKRLDDEPAPRASVRIASTVSSLEETDLADALALVIQKEVAEGHAVVISEDDLEELDLVDDEAAAPMAALPPKEAFEAEVSRSVNQLVGWARSAMSAARAKAGAARAAAVAPAPARPPVQPPPSLSEVPVLSFAAPDKPTAGRKGAAMAAVGAAAALAMAAAGWFWLRPAKEAQPQATAATPAPIPAATPPPLPNDVLLAAERLPQLAPDTVQLLISTSPFGSPDSGDLFRRARVALRRGAAALTPEEGQELAVLERAVLVRLTPPERERVMAYDRVRGARDLLPAEDARVLGLVARGARSLPSPHRERLQALSGKAIAAGLASP